MVTNLTAGSGEEGVNGGPPDSVCWRAEAGEQEGLEKFEPESTVVFCQPLSSVVTNLTAGSGVQGVRGLLAACELTGELATPRAGRSSGT